MLVLIYICSIFEAVDKFLFELVLGFLGAINSTYREALFLRVYACDNMARILSAIGFLMLLGGIDYCRYKDHNGKRIKRETVAVPFTEVLEPIKVPKLNVSGVRIKSQDV